MPMAQTFPQSRDKDGAVLQQFVEKYTDKTPGSIKRGCKLKMPISDISYLTTCTALIGSPLKHPTCHQPFEAALERVVIYALLQSPAGVLEETEDHAEVEAPRRLAQKGVEDPRPMGPPAVPLSCCLESLCSLPAGAGVAQRAEAAGGHGDAGGAVPAAGAPVGRGRGGRTGLFRGEE